MWDKLKGMVWEEDPNTVKAAPVAKSAPAAQPATGGAPAATIGSFTPGVNPQFVEAIRKGVFSKNTALTQLITAADALAELIPDQMTRFKAAYKTTGNGRSPQQIVQAVDIHLADVDGEEARFKVALDQKLGSEIQQATLTVQQADAAVEQMRAEIERAQQRIAQLQTQITETSGKRAEAASAVQTKTAELENTAGAFKLAANAVRAELQQIKVTVSTALA